MGKKSQKKMEELNDFKSTKQRFNEKKQEDEELSVVDMTFEDINKVEMQERMQRMDELKFQQQQQIKLQQQKMNGSGDSYKNGGNDVHDVIRPTIEYDDGGDFEQPPIPKKKKLLYTNSNNDAMQSNGNVK